MEEEESGGKIKVEKVVDISSLCCKDIIDDVVLEYGFDPRGAIVNIKYDGYCVYYFLDTLKRLSNDEVYDQFHEYAKTFGMDSTKLKRLVFEHAPIH